MFCFTMLVAATALVSSPEALEEEERDLDEAVAIAEDESMEEGDLAFDEEILFDDEDEEEFLE